MKLNREHIGVQNKRDLNFSTENEFQLFWPSSQSVPEMMKNTEAVDNSQSLVAPSYVATA